MLEVSADFAMLDVANEPEEQTDEADPQRRAWLRRRDRGFGASELAVLLVALNLRSADILASYQRPEANPIKIRLHPKRKARPIPRIFLRKAGLRRPLAQSETQRLWILREPELVRQWRLRVERGTAGPDAAFIDPRSIRYLPDLGIGEIFPLTDPVEPRLICTPDILARDRFGDLGCVDGKCSFEPYHGKHQGPPAHARIQVNGQIAVCSGTWGGVLEGETWSNGHRDHAGEPSGPIVTWGIERDESLITELRDACREGWRIVEQIREEARA